MQDTFEPRLLREQQEAMLSCYATRSRDSRGRLTDEAECSVRTAFERDVGRIIFSMDFRRMRHKTQVFFNPQNDHICTRMEHVLSVNYIANTIGRVLGLNPDLIQAIALGHDIGHAPFGHSGERTLDQCLKKVSPEDFFQHEVHGLRVVDQLSMHHNRRGLNLTFEVRDGIASHCGETYHETVLIPDRDKDPDDLPNAAKNHGRPATLEGCVVRFADKIAYVGRDIEDAVRAGIMEYQDLPSAVQTSLGKSNGEIINTLVTDIVQNSYQRDGIFMSDACGESMRALLEDNVARIYQSEKIKRYEAMAHNVVEGLFQALLPWTQDPERLSASNNRVLTSFGRFIAERYSEQEALGARQVVDYIAGMTDSFATKCFEELYWF